MKKLLTLLFVALLASPSWSAALPSINDVYGAASRGNLQLAQSEIQQVLAAYPNSAKAHYVDARVLALQGRWAQASTELATAQRLQPGLPFEHADTLAAFTQQVASHATQPQLRSGFPLMGVIGGVLAVIALLALLRLLRTSQQPPVQVIQPQGWQGGVPPQPGYGPAPGYYPQGPGGGGFMGAVGTGLAMGAGMAAGEMLVDRVFGHGGGVSPESGFMPDANAATPLPDDQNFGIADSGSWGDDSGGGDWSGGGGSDSWN